MSNNTEKFTKLKKFVSTANNEEYDKNDKENILHILGGINGVLNICMNSNLLNEKQINKLYELLLIQCDTDLYLNQLPTITFTRFSNNLKKDSVLINILFNIIKNELKRNELNILFPKEICQMIIEYINFIGGWLYQQNVRMKYVSNNRILLKGGGIIFCDYVIDIKKYINHIFKYSITLHSIAQHFHPGFVKYDQDIKYNEIKHGWSVFGKGCSFNTGPGHLIDVHVRKEYCPNVIAHNINYKTVQRIDLRKKFNKVFEKNDVLTFIINGKYKTCQVYLNKFDLGIIWKNIPNKIIPAISCSKTDGEYSIKFHEISIIK